MITDKVRSHHLERKALLYVRQSSPHQVLHNHESSALHTARSGAAEILVDHLDLGPSKRRQPILHRILQRAALTVVQHLMR